jgi:flagellar biogenesis protein FliO
MQSIPLLQARPRRFSGVGPGLPAARRSPVVGFGRLAAAGIQLCLVLTAAGQSTNAVALPAPALPDLGVSLLRVFGALAVVLAVFLGGVWLLRNWQRLVVQRGRVPRLNILEVRSLGGRHALYVIGFQQERFLIATSPAGVNLVSHLQNEGEEAPDKAETTAPVSFARTFAHLLKGK